MGVLIVLLATFVCQFCFPFLPQRAQRATEEKREEKNESRCTSGSNKEYRIMKEGEHWLVFYWLLVIPCSLLDIQVSYSVGMAHPTFLGVDGL